MQIEIKIPIRSYLKKFIAYTHPVEPFALSNGKNCAYSSIFLERLGKGFQPLKEEYKDYNDTLTLLMNSSICRYNSFNITPETITHIDGKLRDLFMRQMFITIDLIEEKKGDIFAAIRDYMKQLDITEEDIKFETLIKNYYRYRHPYQKVEPALIKQQIAQLNLFQ